MGERTINLEGNLVVRDEQNGLKAVVVFNPVVKSGLFSLGKNSLKQDEFLGQVYRCSKFGKHSTVKKLSELKDVEEIL